MLPDRLSAYENAPLDELLAILLRQFRRALASRGVELSEAEAEALARALVAHADPGDQAQAVRAALAELVAESERLLARWNLTFQQSLDTKMDAIPDWESTAEFLDIALEKANAELRISTGGALLTVLGDEHYIRDLLFLAERTHGAEDPDPIIARRVLLFASQVDPNDPQGLEKLRQWVSEKR